MFMLHPSPEAGKFAKQPPAAIAPAQPSGESWDDWTDETRWTTHLVVPEGTAEPPQYEHLIADEALNVCVVMIQGRTCVEVAEAFDMPLSEIRQHCMALRRGSQFKRGINWFRRRAAALGICLEDQHEIAAMILLELYSASGGGFTQGEYERLIESYLTDARRDALPPMTDAELDESLDELVRQGRLEIENPLAPRGEQRFRPTSASKGGAN